MAATADRRGFCVALLAIAGLVNVVEPRAVTIAGGSCTETCSPTDKSPLGFQPGKTYSYDLEGSTVLSVPASTEERRVTLKGKVKLVVISQCEGAIVLENVQPVESEGEKYPVADLDKYPLRFSWNGGKVASVCPDAEDPEKAVNIKRAVLSALQNSLGSLENGVKTIKEVDVSGECDTVYDVSVPWTGTQKTVKKTKDLIKCRDRTGYKSVFQFESSLHDLSEINNLPQIRSEHKCEQELSAEKLISKVTCTESHAYRPFVQYGKEAEVKVKFSLKLTGSSAGANPGAGSGKLTRTCLRYHHAKKLWSIKTAAAQAESMVTHICEATNDGMASDVPDDSYELIHMIRRMSKDDILALRNKIKGGQICAASERMDHFFTELLPQAGGAGAIGTMVHIIKNEKTDAVERQVFEASMAFDRYPSPESVEATLPLLEGKSCIGAMLGSSALAHSYCRINPDCQQESAISQLIASLARHLDGGCNPSSDEEKDIIIGALKAFGNLGRADEAAEQKILTCAANKKINPAVRVAAIDAFRRMSCGSNVKTQLLNIFGDSVDDTDVRIEAYLTVMGCACSGVVSKVQDVLDRKEESRQVIAYVESHMRNLQRTSTPSKQALKKLVADVKLQDKYRLPNYLKESRNEELSLFNKALGIGASGETNVIYSQRSYVPRSASLNLTLESFGNTMNIFEIGGRLENMEKRLESIFGPSGTVRTVAEDLKEKLDDKLETLRTRASRSLTRSKRSPVSDHELITNQIDDGFGPKKIYGEEPSADIYIRIFGNELMWVPLTEKKLEEVVSQLEEAGEENFKNVDALSSWNFLDGYVVIPTVLGLPVKVGTNATISTGLKYEESNAKFDFPNANLKLKVTPSAVLTLTGFMMIDGYSVKQSARLVGTLQATPSVDFHFESSENGLQAKLNLPKNDMDLFKISTQSYFVTKAKGSGAKLTPVKLDKTNRERSVDACVPGMGKILGVKLCFSGKYLGPSGFPSLFEAPGRAAYPGEVAVTLKREDAGIKGYELVGKWDLKGKEPELTLYVDAPGSTEDRKIGLSLAAKSGPERKYEIFFKTPLNKMSATVDYVEEPQLRRFGAKLQCSEKTWAFNIATGVEKNGDRKVYTPVIDYTTPSDGTQKILEGKIDYVKAKQLDFELRPLLTKSLEGTSVQGSFAFDWSAEKQEVEIKKMLLDLKDHKVSTSGSLKLNKPNYSFDIATEFGEKSKPETVKMTGNVVDNSRRDFAHFKGELSAESSLFKNWGATKIEFETKKEPGHWLNDVAVTRGPSQKKFSIHQDIKYSGLASLASTSVDAEIKMSDTPYTTSGFELDHTLQANSKHIKHVWNLDYLWNQEKKQIRSTLDLTDNGSVEKADLALKATLAYPGTTFEFTDSFVETEKGVYTGNSELKVTPGDTYTLKLDIVDKKKEGQKKEDRQTTQKFDAVVTSTGWGSPVEVTISRILQPGILTFDTEVRAEGEQKLHAEAQWQIRDGEGAHSLERFDVSGLLFLKDVIDAKGSAKNEKPLTTLELSAEFPKLEDRKIEAKAIITEVAASIRKIDAVLAWDAKRNPNKKLSVQSEITKPDGKWELDTKSSLKYMDDEYGLNLKGSLSKYIDNGKNGLEAELTLPSGKSLFVDTHFEVATEATTYQNEILLNFKTLDNDYWKVKLNTDVKNKNYRLITGNLKMDAQIDTPLWGGSVAVKTDSTKEGNARNVDVTGTLTPSATADPFEGRLSVGVEPGKTMSLGTKLAHGADIYVDTEGVAKFDLSSTVKEVDLKVSFKAPKLDLSEVSIDAEATSYWNNIDDAKTDNKLTVVVADSRYQVSNVFQAADKRITGTAAAEYNGDKMASLTYSVDRTIQDVYTSNVEIDVFGSKTVADFEHRDEAKWWKVAYGVRADLMMLGFEPFEHKLDAEKKDNAAHVTSNAVFDGAEVYALKADASLDRKAPSLKASLSLAEEKPMTLDLALKNKRGRGGYALDGKAVWSQPDGYAEFSGEAKFVAVPLSFDVMAKLDSPQFKIKKWEVTGSSKLDGNKRTLLVKAGNAEDKEAYVVEVEYVKDVNDIKGTGRLHFQTNKFRTEFSLPTDWVNQDIPASIVVKSVGGAGGKQQTFKDLEFKREKKADYKEVIYTLKAAMKKSTYTLQLDVLNNRPIHGVDGKLTLTFKAQAKRQMSVYSTVAALSTQNEAIVAELITSQGEGEDAKKFGIATDLRHGHLDTAVYILERVIREQLTWSGWEKNQNGNWKLDLGSKIWLDFKREPEQVLSHTLEIRELDALKGHHWTASLVGTHPGLEKELRITDELVINGEDRPLYFKAHFDVYGAGQQPLEVSLEQKHTNSGDDWECSSALIVSRPADIDFRIVRSIKKQGHVLTANSKISGGKTERDSSSIEANAMIDCGDSPKMSFSLSGPGQSLELEGAEEASSRKKRATTKPGDGPEEDKWVWTLKQTDSVPIKAEVIFSTDISMPSLSIQVYDADAPGKRLRWRSGYVNPTTLDLKLDSVNNGAETLYVRRTIVLRDDHVLSHKLSWKEENFRGLWEGAKYRGKMAGEHVLDGIKSAHELVTQWHNSYKAAGRLEPANGPVKAWLQNEVEEFIEELESDQTVLTVQAVVGIDDLRGSLEAMVDTVKNAHNAGAALFEKLLEVLEKTLGDDLGFTAADIHNWIERSGDELEKLWKDLKSLYQTILDEVKSGKDEIDMEVVLNFIDNVLQKAKNIFEFTNDFIKQIKEEYKVDEIMEKLEVLNDTIDTLMGYVWECRYFKPLKEFYDEARKWFREEFRINRVKVGEAWDGLKDSANDVFTESGGKFVVWKPEDGEIEIDIPVPEAIHSLRLPLSPFQKFFESAEDTGILKTIWEFVYGSFRTLDKIEYPELDQALETLSDLFQDFLALFNPENIRTVLSSLAFSSKPAFGFSVPSPGYFEYYSSGGELADEKTFVESAKTAVEMAKDALKYTEALTSAAGVGSLAQSSWLGSILGEAALFSPLQALPPYKTSAYLAGHDHLVSFDRKVHNFAGKCKYLLARENVEGKYSLEADYTGSSDPEHPKRSLVFNAKASDGSYNVIEIASDYSVKLNGQPANPPFKAENVWVTRESPSHLQVHWDEEGVTLVCETWSDFCRFRLSGWAHGRVSGLLGSNDREVITDMLSPSGEKVATVADLASKWKITDSCQDSPRTYSGPGLPACIKSFSDEFSPFGDCFKRVDPKPFHQACMELPLSDKDGFCRLADAYRMACFEKGKTLPQVEECGKCEFEGRSISEGIATEVKTSGTEADVVVVVNQADCFGNSVSLDAFVKELKSQAKDQGISDLHLGLVGYGNKDIDNGNPTILTSGGQVWFEGDVPGVDLKGENNRATLSALLMATSFEFRPQATKAVVLLTCKPCQRRVEDMLLGRYYQVEKELLRRGITLHALSAQDITVKAAKKKLQKQVIGVDGGAAYKVNSLKGKDFQPDSGLRSDVSLEPDYCTQLAQSSHGSVFSLARLREAEDKAKNFRQVFARRVVASLTGPENVGVCQRCSCTVNAWARPVVKCELCEPRSGDLGYRAKDQA